MPQMVQRPCTGRYLDPDSMMIRARRLDHLRGLRKRFPQIADLEIVSLAHRDYRYRLMVPKKVWVEILAELATEQEWSNFKNEVARYQASDGSDYTDALRQIWSLMYNLQEKESHADRSHRSKKG
jgi:hypothetical protein